MKFWNELSLEPTADVKKIKQAYSQKLKGLDRKHDIDGFQRLHEAYQSALEFVKSGGTEAQDTSPSSSEMMPNVSVESIRSHAAEIATVLPETTSEIAPSRLGEALEHFFQEIARYPEIDCIQDAYERLRDRFSLGRDLLRDGLMDHFLHELYAFLNENPSCADANLIQQIFRDLQFLQDIKLYQEYEYAIRRIGGLVQLEAQRRDWLQQVDDGAARILLHKDLKAGYRERRKRHVLPHIMDAIAKLENQYHLLIGPYVAAEKLEFWKQIDRSILITQDDHVNAFWGLVLIPGVYAAVTLQYLNEVLNPAMIVASYPLALLYIVLVKRLRFKIQENLALSTFLDRRDIRVGTLVVNAIYAVGALAMNLKVDGHALSVVGVFSLFVVLIRTMPLGILACGTILGSIVLAILQPAHERVDLALATQLGTALFFLLIALQSYGQTLWTRWRPKKPESKAQQPASPPLLTMRNIVIAVILLKVLAALARLKY